MKKLLIPVIIIMMICGIIYGGRSEVRLQGNKEIVEDISSKIIRFHVIANSDDDLDQSLKLKIRDQVLEYIQPLLKDSQSIEESRTILKEEDEHLKDIARKVIADNGYNYEVESTLDRENFPVKTYGNITLPAGDYEAYRIIIGSGQGQNWWCVMFPPICFVDITKGTVAYEETEKEMGRVLSDEEMELVDNTEDNMVVVKFKALEIIKSLLK